jgi:hypothetical protein
MSASHDRPPFVVQDFSEKCKIFPERNVMLLPFQSKWVLDNSGLKLAVKEHREVEEQDLVLLYARHYGRLLAGGSNGIAAVGMEQSCSGLIKLSANVVKSFRA